MQPEQITFQNFSLNPVDAKQFLMNRLRVFLSDNLQENERNLDNLISTLFSIQSADVRVTFAELIDSIKNFPAKLIEPQLKMNLLKNLSQLTSNEIIILCKSLTEFNTRITNLLGNKNTISPMVLLFALQFPAEYKKVLTGIEDLIQNKDKNTMLEFMSILSSFMPRALSFVFNPNPLLVAMTNGSRAGTISLCNYIVELAKENNKPFIIDRLTSLFTQPHYFELFDKNIILFEEVHKISRGMMATIDLLSANGIEINRKIFQLFLTLKKRYDSQKDVIQELKTALSNNYKFTTESYYLFLQITQSHVWQYTGLNNRKVSLALQFINVFGIDILSNISEQTITRPGLNPSVETLLDSLIRVLLKINLLTDDFLNDIKKDFVANRTSPSQFLALVKEKINKHPDVIAAQKKEAEQQQYRNRSPQAIVAPLSRPVPFFAGATGSKPTAVPAVTAKHKEPEPMDSTAAAQAIPALQSPPAFVKPAPQPRTANLSAAVTSANQLEKAKRLEIINKRKLEKLSVLLANQSDFDLRNLNNKSYTSVELDDLIVEINLLKRILDVKKLALANPPCAQVSNPVAINVAATTSVSTTTPSTIPAQSELVQPTNTTTPTTIGQKSTETNEQQENPNSARKDPTSASGINAYRTHGLLKKRPLVDNLLSDELTDAYESDYTLTPSTQEKEAVTTECDSDIHSTKRKKH